MKKKTLSAKGNEAENNVTFDERLEPLRTAAGRIAEMVRDFSADSELFVSDTAQSCKRKLDTKTLKEFTSVIKEMSAVICELYGIGAESEADGDGILIEFSDGAGEYAE